MAATAMLTIHAYAKLNLTLEVTGTRPDGYHSVATVLQTVDLKDTLNLEHSPTISVECSLPELDGEHNLVSQAVNLLKKQTNYSEGVRIHLEKNIPVSAGLGGGSSDAAATLRGLNRLWGLRLADKELYELAIRLGTDVAFFLKGGTAFGENRGEKLTPLPAPEGEVKVVILHPPIEIPTKTAVLYAALDSSYHTEGEYTRSLIQILRNRNPISEDLIFNGFEPIAPDIFDGLDEFADAFQRAGAIQVHLCGTGPSLFALTASRQAHSIYDQLRFQGYEIYIVNLISSY
jgi:4-diphosphocytidyl-2-C-methyl-D-erythritol kinase